MYPPTQIDKNVFFHAIGHNETSGVKECFFATFSKMTKLHSFHFNCAKFQKSNFVFAEIFCEFALKLLPYFHVTPKKYYVLWKMALSRNIEKHRGSVWICPQRPQTALKFALKDFSWIIGKHRGEVKCAFFDVNVV